MLNIIDLEKRWVRYKIKSYIPHLTILISSLIIIGVFLSYKLSVKSSPLLISATTIKEEVPKAIIPRTPMKIQKPLVQVTNIQKVKYQPRLIQPSKGVKLSPSLGFMRKMQSSVQPDYRENQNNNILSESSDAYKVSAPKVEVVKQKIVQAPEHKPHQTVKKITIKRQNTQNDIYEIIKRFKKNSNPTLSLFVAKKYYELGDYQQAYNYALITNGINKNIESSWIIFSKSLVKLGKREKAIKTLKQYIEQSHSSSARVLLDEIYAGKFK